MDMLCISKSGYNVSGKDKNTQAIENKNAWIVKRLIGNAPAVILMTHNRRKVGHV